jgi:hypothetical protein
MEKNEIVHLITSSEWEKFARDEWKSHKPDVEINIELVSEEERQQLIDYEEENLDKMSDEKIMRRIAALEAIKFAPHFMFNHSADEKTASFAGKVFSTTLNGNGGLFANNLKNYLQKRKKDRL